MTPRKPAVFLDRDGVLNALVERDGGVFSPRRAADFRLFPWTASSLASLAAEGFTLVVVTNQPDIARGLMDPAELDAMHSVLSDVTPISRVYVCPHDSGDGCSCRKPQPGMFLQAAEELGLDLQSSWTVGDRNSDIEAGRLAGTNVIHVSGGQERPLDGKDTVAVPSLREAVQHIIASFRRSNKLG